MAVLSIPASVTTQQQRLLGEVRDKLGINTFELQVVPKPMRFKQGYNDFNKAVGWAPVSGLPDAVPPSMVVHDMLEHFVEGDEKPHWEFAAIGTAIWLRGEGGYFGKDFGAGNSPIWLQLANSAFGMLFFHIVGKQLKTKKCPLLRAAYVPLPNATEIVVKRSVLTALDHIKNSYNKAHHALIEESFIHGEPWIRLGYQLATARYTGLSNKQLSALYTKATTHISDLLSSTTSDDEIELAISPPAYAYSLTLHSQNKELPS